MCPKGVYDRKKAAKKRGQKKYAAPLRGRGRPRKALAKKSTVKRAYTKRTKKAEFDPAFFYEKLQTLVDVQQAAFMDHFLGFYLTEKGTAQEFVDMFPMTYKVMGITLEDLEAIVAGYKEEPAFPEPDSNGQVEQHSLNLL